MSPSIDDTINLMMFAHEGQLDKAGEPYWTHPMRVMARLVLRTPEISLDAMHAALLHDVIEDGHIAEIDLQRDYPARVVALVTGITRDKSDGLTYFEWVRSIAATGDRELMLIKLADNEDNADPVRLARLENAQRINLTSRYRMSMRILTEALDDLQYPI